MRHVFAAMAATGVGRRRHRPVRPDTTRVAPPEFTGRRGWWR